MALPPDPIEELLPQASAAVMAEVVAIVSEDPQKPFAKLPPGTTSGNAGDVARQVVELRVDEALFGKLVAGAKLKAVKPAGAYKLLPGNKGPFLLQQGKGDAVILGRYGPDSYGRKAILEAAARAKK